MAEVAILDLAPFRPSGDPKQRLVQRFLERGRQSIAENQKSG
jgi:hypothetical protein